jgi:arylsulfatase A-like enzyme
MGRGGSDQKFQGRSLLPALTGAEAEEEGEAAVLSRTVWDRPRYARRDDGYKFIYDTRTGDEELYDIAQDPGEKTNLVASDPLRAAWSRQALHHWIASAARAETSGIVAPGDVSREQCENLKALGYVGAGTKCPEH